MPTPERDVDRPPVRTAALDEFLRGSGSEVRRLSAARMIEVIREIQNPPEALLDDPTLVATATVVLWRWSRAAAQAVGRLSDDETLEDALGDADPDPFLERLVARPTPAQRALLRMGATSTLYQAVSGPGIALLPMADDRIARWCETFETVAGDLGVRRGPRGPDLLRLLTDPHTAAQLPVSRHAVLAVEELVIDEAQRVLLRHGERAVMDHFSSRYGISRREGLGLVRLARADAVKYGRSSVEDDRAIAVALLKDMLDRARETMNMGDEIRIVKELARVQGLTRSDPEDKAAEFLGVVRAVSGRQDALRLAPGAAEALDVDPEDAAEIEGDLALAFPTDADAMPEDATFRIKESDSVAAFDAAEEAR